MKLRKILDRIPSGFNEAVLLTLVQGTFWFSWSFSIYQNVYLQGHGFTSSQIGLLNGVVSLLAIFAMTFWGIVSDKINSIKRAFLIACSIGSVLYALFPLIPTNLSFSLILFIVYASLVNFARGPAPVLMDNITVRNCTEQHLNFGIIRGFGSFSFTIGGFVIVWLISFLGVDSTFWLYAIAMIPCFLLMLRVHDPKAQAVKKDKLNLNELFRNYYYVVLLIFCAIFYIGASGEYTFLTYLMEDKNIPIEKLGTVLAVRALLEIPFLLMISKLHKRFKLKHLLWVACSLMGLECILLGFGANTYAEFMGTIVFFGLGNGLFIGTIPMYIYKLAPDHLKASAQTVFASVSSVSAIIGNICGGFIYQKMGGNHFYILLGVIIYLAVLFFMISTGIRKGLPNPADVKD